MNDTEKIQEIIAKLNREIIDLEYCNHVRVNVRIDEITPFLKDIYAIAVDDIESRLFDLSGSIANGTFTFLKNGSSVSAGANVLKYDDTLKITATPSTHYTLKSLKVNGSDFTNGGTLTVDNDIAVIATMQGEAYNLTQTISNGSIAYEVEGESISAGTGVIRYGDSLKITVTADTGYQVDSISVNGSSFTSGNSVTIEGNVAVVVVTSAAASGGTTFTVGENYSGAYFNIGLTNISSITSQLETLPYEGDPEEDMFYCDILCGDDETGVIQCVKMAKSLFGTGEGYVYCIAINNNTLPNGIVWQSDQVDYGDIVINAGWQTNSSYVTFIKTLEVTNVYNFDAVKSLISSTDVF